MKAVVLVGGPSRGTRFRPLSLEKPKPLFPVAGYPMVYHHVAALAKLPELKEILLVGFYEPQLFQHFIDEASSEFKGVTIRYLREYQSLGTGGGLYHFRDQILRGSPEYFFVLHADICCSLPVAQILDFHKKHKGQCTILATKVPKETASRYGCIVADPESFKVLHYVEKPETFVSDLISCGIYLFRKEIFAEMEKVVKEHNQNASKLLETEGYDAAAVADVVRLEHDILRPLAGTDKLFVYETTEFWRQVKTAGSVLLANKLALLHYHKVSPNRLAVVSSADQDGNKDRKGPLIIGDVYIHPTATIHPSAKIGPNVSIGARAVIGKGVRVRESIILDSVEVKPYACIIYSIIGWHSRIGSWSRIEGTPYYSTEPNFSPASNISDLGPNVSTHPLTDLMLQSGMKNQSVTIFGDSVTVMDELIIRNCVVLPHKALKNSYKNEILM